jgi:hypothetical protein
VRTARHNHTDIDGSALERLRRAYADPEISLDSLKMRFKLSEYRIRQIAGEHGWPIRVWCGRAIRFEKAATV